MMVLAAFVFANGSWTRDASTVDIDMIGPVDSTLEVFGKFVNEDFIVYPNSEYKSINMQFNIKVDAELSCFIYDVDNNIVKSMDFGVKHAGSRHIVVPVENLDEGKYKVQIYSEGMSLTKWIELIR